MCSLSSLSADYFIGFGKCLSKDEAELGKVWDEALGRYDSAVLNLVVDVLQEAQNPEEKLYNALNEMRTPESAQRAVDTIHKGTYLHYVMMAHDIKCFCTTALLSEGCLAILVKGVHNHSPLGQLLGIEESTLEAIAKYYNNTSDLIIGHVIVMWLLHDPESPLKQLSEGLNAIGEHERATNLTLLSSLGEEVCQ